MSQATVLIVEDDPDLREALADTLQLAQFATLAVDSGEAALEAVQTRAVDMVISDVNMGGMNGPYGAIASAVRAMRNGAVDYLIKPFTPRVLVDAVSRYLQGTCSATDADSPVAEAPCSQQLLELANKVAMTSSTVLISGESGTGKEVLARYIHTHSPRAGRAFVAINCAAIPENMLEATLFGHEKGAFTGAYSASAGKFEQADGGTILLDEISEMDLGLQAKLLRVLQEREVERVGGKKLIKLDVRVIATTNRDLLQCVAAGSFREDLYYRLSVFPMQWLPLRERRADIQPLARRLLAVHAAKMGRNGVRLDGDAAAKLFGHPWPGNVRELDNVIQRALIMQPGDQICAADLLLEPLAAATPAVPVATPAAAESAPNPQPLATPPGTPLGSGVKEHEYQLIIDALKHEGGRKKQAAEKLGISARTLRYKMAKMRDSGFDLEAALNLRQAYPG